MKDVTKMTEDELRNELEKAVRERSFYRRELDKTYALLRVLKPLIPDTPPTPSAPLEPPF